MCVCGQSFHQSSTFEPFVYACVDFTDKSFKPVSNSMLMFVFFPGIRLVGFPSGRSSRTLKEKKGPGLLRRKRKDTRTYRKWWASWAHGSCGDPRGCAHFPQQLMCAYSPTPSGSYSITLWLCSGRCEPVYTSSFNYNDIIAQVCSVFHSVALTCLSNLLLRKPHSS